MPLNGLFKLVNKFWLVTDLGLADYLETDATCVNCEGIDALCLGTRLGFFANGGGTTNVFAPFVSRGWGGNK